MKKQFYETINAAIDDVLAHGFDSPERLDRWLAALKHSAAGVLAPAKLLQRALKSRLGQAYKHATGTRQLLKVHKGVSMYTLANVKPELRDELARRVAASASLIELNKKEALQNTLKRFAGWVTSIPAGGAPKENREDTRKEIRKGIAGLPFEERRVIVDQSHKLVASINEIVAADGGAIALIWKHVKEAGYNARPEHEARDGNVYLLRDSWADQKGYVKGRYYDTITAVGEEINCRCTAEYLYAIRDLPPENVTAAGKEALLQARRLLAS